MYSFCKLSKSLDGYFIFCGYRRHVKSADSANTGDPAVPGVSGAVNQKTLLSFFLCFTVSG